MIAAGPQNWIAWLTSGFHSPKLKKIEPRMNGALFSLVKEWIC